MENNSEFTLSEFIIVKIINIYKIISIEPIKIKFLSCLILGGIFCKRLKVLIKFNRLIMKIEKK